jgi:hypothetical protein
LVSKLPFPCEAKSGLLKTIGVETLPSTAPVLPGQVPCWYSGPSKSLSACTHPVNAGFSVAPEGPTIGAGKQAVSSLSSPAGSVAPAAVHTPRLAVLQYSK